MCKHFAPCFLLLVTVGFPIGCSSEETDTENTGNKTDRSGERLVVMAVNYPLHYMAERIAGDLADVRFPVPSDIDPAFWRPSADDVIAFQQADVVLLNGAGYAKWTEQASLPLSRLVRTSRAFDDALIEIVDAIRHKHGPSGEHSHSGTAFTTWLDFDQARQQASAVHDALVAKLPESKDRLKENFAALEDDLIALDETMAAIAEELGDQPLVVSHPVYQYWARRYALNVRSVHWEPDVVPDDESFAQLTTLQSERRAKWMIWEGEPNAEVVERLKSLEIGSVVFSPCANRPATGDWMDGMRRNLDALRAAMSP